MRNQLFVFVTSDNRRQNICSIRIHTKNALDLSHRTSAYNYLLNENTLRRLITACFKFNSIIKISREDNKDISFVVIKKKSTYFINGDKISGKNLNKLLNFIFVKFRAYKDADEIDDDVIKFQETDPLISDVIINKLKYNYYSPSLGRYEETLLNMQIIGKDTVAFELYSDKWIPFSNKEAIQFIRACRGGDNKFFAIPYQELYRRATGDFLSSSEEKVIDAFLLQNRSSNLVTKRSMELVEKLTTFPAISRLEIFLEGEEKANETGLYIRGAGASWAVTHNYEEDKHVLGRQNVRTQHLAHLTNLVRFGEGGNYTYQIMDSEDRGLFSASVGSLAYTDGKNYYLLGGSICIDQMDYNISLGDQIASRSLLLMSDKSNLDKVSTLRGYGKSMDLPRNKEVINDGLLTLRRVELTTKTLESLLR